MAGTAGEGADFLPVEGIVGFEPGESRKNVAVPVVGDTDDETDETFSLTLYGPQGGPLLDSVGLGRIVDDDPRRVGYRLVAADGGIFAFGSAQFAGSTGALRLNHPIVGMQTGPDGMGYWLVASDGGIFSFGSTTFYGSTGSMTLNRPIVSMDATPSAGGYWLVATDGGIFAFSGSSR